MLGLEERGSQLPLLKFELPLAMCGSLCKTQEHLHMDGHSNSYCLTLKGCWGGGPTNKKKTLIGHKFFFFLFLSRLWALEIVSISY